LEDKNILSYLKEHPNSIETLKNIADIFNTNIPEWVITLMLNNINRLDDIYDIIKKTDQIEKNNTKLLGFG
jgi:hypothetical protein